MKIKNRKIAELIPAEYNPRALTDKERADLRGSLERFGIVDPVIVNTHAERKNIIVGGHQRCLVWEGMGNDTIPTIEVELTEAQERELNIRLNKNTGHWDWQGLEEYFKPTDLIEWGFDGSELLFMTDIDNDLLEEDISEKEFDDNIETSNQCPKCSYEW